MKPSKEQSCSCPKCKELCTITPGWFSGPEEVKETAKFLNLSTKELFDKYLVVGIWHGWDEVESELEDINVLAPGTVSYSPGRVSMFLHNDTCVFYKNERCEIHSVKPFECAMYNGCEENTKVNRKEIVKEWAKPESQEFIRQILNEEAIKDAFND